MTNNFKEAIKVLWWLCIILVGIPLAILAILLFLPTLGRSWKLQKIWTQFWVDKGWLAEGGTD